MSTMCALRVEQIFSNKNVLQHRLVWGMLATGLFFLGLNKQLDLQSWFTAVIKAIAYEKGFFELGQTLQVWFIIGLAVASVVIFGGLIWTLRHVWRQYWLIFLGALFLARFILVRAASFYGVPLPQLSRFTGGFRINWLLELLGTIVIIIAAGLNLRRAKNTEPGGDIGKIVD